MATRAGGSWHNWAGNQTAAPRDVVHPSGTDELVHVVKDAAARGLRVKAVGSGHSFTDIAVTDGVQVVLDRHAEVLAADPSTGRVTVQSGIRLHDLNERLAGLGLALTNLGDIDAQTVAGALSTGTHGTGLRVGGLATQVAALTLVLADGSVVHCDADEEPELFAAARVGLGALGLLDTVTLQAEPAFTLRAQELPVPLAEVLDDLDGLFSRNEHAEFYWFPNTDVALTKQNNRTDTAAPLGPVRTWLEDELAANAVFDVLCRAGRAVPALVPRLNGFAARTMAAREFADRSDRVFVSPRRVRFCEMEYGFPREALREVLDGLRAFLDTSGLRISFPVEVRAAAADDIWLSTAYGRESAYLAVHTYRGVPYEQYFRGVERIVDAVGGRPHWGKLHFQTAATLRTRYPRFDDFTALRARLDPEGRFANAYLDRVLGPV